MPSLRHRTLSLLAPSSRRVAPARSRCRHHRSAALQIHQTRRCLNRCDRLTATNVKLPASMRMEMSAYSKSTHLPRPEMIIAELVSSITLASVGAGPRSGPYDWRHCKLNAAKTRFGSEALVHSAWRAIWRHARNSLWWVDGISWRGTVKRLAIGSWMETKR